MLAGTIDGRCGCEKCRSRTENIYRQVSGKCRNCGAGPFLLLYRGGDPASSQTCPRCGTSNAVSAERPATDDEIPASALEAHDASRFDQPIIELPDKHPFKRVRVTR